MTDDLNDMRLTRRSVSFLIYELTFLILGNKKNELRHSREASHLTT